MNEKEYRNENGYSNEMNTGMKQCNLDGNEGTKSIYNK